MKKFEYLVLNKPSIKHINEAGEEGWELVAVDSYNGKFYFKREIDY